MTQRTGVGRFVAFLRFVTFSVPLAAGVVTAAVTILPLFAKADEVMSVTRDQISIGRIDSSGKRDDLTLTTPPRNVNGTTQQNWSSPGYSTPEVQVHVPWYGPSRPRHPVQRR